MSLLRQLIAQSLHIPVSNLGCFTITDHDDQPATLIVHGLQAKGVYTEPSFPNSTLQWLQIS